MLVLLSHVNTNNSILRFCYYSDENKKFASTEEVLIRVLLIAQVYELARDGFVCGSLEHVWNTLEYVFRTII